LTVLQRFGKQQLLFQGFSLLEVLTGEYNSLHAASFQNPHQDIDPEDGNCDIE
jgi:hypothetical protein